MKDETLHEHHRERMRKKYLATRDAMPDHEILEILLFTIRPRVNTNPIAHRLIKRFGSLDGVFCASYEELLTVEGVGEATAFFLRQIAYLQKRCEGVGKSGALLDTVDKIGRYLVSLYRDEPKEAVYLLFLDASARLIQCVKLAEGTLTASEVTARNIAEAAFRCNAPRFILAHNHPGGVAEPTDSDVSVTRYLRRILLPLDITLEEHFIIAPNTYCPIMLYLQEKFRGEKGC